jgi:hypothetical protein
MSSPYLGRSTSEQRTLAGLAWCTKGKAPRPGTVSSEAELDQVIPWTPVDGRVGWGSRGCDYLLLSARVGPLGPGCASTTADRCVASSAWNSAGGHAVSTRPPGQSAIHPRNGIRAAGTSCCRLLATRVLTTAPLQDVRRTERCRLTESPRSCCVRAIGRGGSALVPER